MTRRAPTPTPLGVPSAARVRRRAAILPLLATATVAAGLWVVPSPAASAVEVGAASACPVAATEDGFTDTGAEGSALESAVDCLVSAGIARGRDGAFGAGGEVTRGQLASFLVNLLGASGTPRPIAAPNAFPDDDGTTHEASIDAAVALGALKGFPDGTFRPGGSVTRAQMASFLVGALRAGGADLPVATADAFSDDGGLVHEANINVLAQPAVAIVSGEAGGRFNPDRVVQRQTMALFLSRTHPVLATAVDAARLKGPSVRRGDLVAAPTTTAPGGVVTAPAPTSTITAPTTTAPATTAPSTTAPATTVPSTTAPSTTAPRTSTVKGDVATAEARLLADPSVLWVGTADEGDWRQRWGVSGAGRINELSLVAAPGGIRGQSIGVANAGGGTSGDRWGYDGRFGFEQMGLARRDDAYLRYYVWFPADYEFDTQGKMPGLQGVLPGQSPWLANESVPCTSGPYVGKDCHDDRQFGARTMWKNGGMITYLNVAAVGTRLHDDVRTAGGNMYSFSFTYRDAAGAALQLRPGWNYVEQRVRLNTPGVSDGLFEGWINGVKGISLRDVQYRTAARADLRISQWNLAHFWGGPPTDYPQRATQVLYDDVVISAAPIGGRVG